MAADLQPRVFYLFQYWLNIFGVGVVSGLVMAYQFETNRSVFADNTGAMLGSFASAFWILSVNSWMQTHAGYAINAQGQFVPADWPKVIFNPSFPFPLVHMVLAAYLTTALVVGAGPSTC